MLFLHTRNFHEFHEQDEIAKLNTHENSVFPTVEHWENVKIKYNMIFMFKNHEELKMQ